MTIGKAHLSCLSVLFMCSAILGCQSVSGLAGEGDLVLSTEAANSIVNNVHPFEEDAKVVVSDDASSVHFLTGTSTFYRGPSLQDVVGSCEQKTGGKCYLFSDGQEIVWKGRIVIGTTGLQISDRDLKGSNSNGMAALRNFMDSLNYGSTGIRVRMADLSDGVLCINATAASGTGLRWEVRERYLPHVAEAKKRGLTPETCRR